MAIDLAVEELNAAGGVNGRKIELLKEDSVNPQTASTKAERMIERDKVACIIGEISSASCLTIAQVAQRTKTLYVNTGGNSDALRGADCKKFMFHVESQNSMYVKSVGRSFLAAGLVKGKSWYSLTADYAFGHDLLKVAKRFMEGNGGKFAADELVPTDATDFSAYLLKIRSAKPDLVVLEPRRQPDHQFPEAIRRVRPDLPGRRLRLRHGARLGGRQGQLRRHLAGGLAPPDRHPRQQGLRRRLHKKYGKPPENQAWGDYIAMKIVAQSMNETEDARSAKLVEHWEKGAKFDLLKTREGYFRASDHQLMHEMYAVTALPAAR